jgi:Colicin V production protein.
MNWLLIGIISILILFMVIGYIRGFIKKIVSICSLIVALILVSFLTPYTSSFIQNYTPIYASIKGQCLNNIQEPLSKMEGSTKSAQIQFINELPVPASVKEGLISNNNSSAYTSLAVEQFSDYVAGYLAKWIVNAISYIVVFIFVIIFLRIIFMTLDLVSKFPIINGINKMLGLLMGFIEGILVMWLLFLVLTIFINTTLGAQAFLMINNSKVLTFLYNNNYLLKVITNLFL